MKRIFWLSIVLMTLFEACGAGEGPDTYYPPQTKIVRIDLTPDTVATQDTVLIHCVIEESLDKRFTYTWLLGKDTLAVNGTVTGPYIRYIAPDLSIHKGSIFVDKGTVAADNGRTDSLAVSKTFDIPVIKK